ncbi:T9SS type A sorting domain-containing protein [Dyadobacter jejuensis]|nr:T9SS type A sorting domain-containing protein [Dyadobacter jejuensis]
MKNYLLSGMLALLATIPIQAQFVVGTEGVTILSNTSTAINGLTVTPTADMTISDNALTISSTEILGSPSSISRVYEFATPILFEGELGLYYLDPSELNGNIESNLQVAYISNDVPITSMGSTVNSDDNYVYNSITPEVSISKITAATLGALPVTLVEFGGKQEENRIVLNWKTTEETNSDFFEIQKRLNNKTWMALGRVTSTTNSSEPKAYSFFDNNPWLGNNLYRLKMVDLDGTFAFSKIINVTNDEEFTVVVYPNPVGDRIVIHPKYRQDIASLRLLNTQGQELLRSYDHLPIDIKSLPAGIYLLQLQNASGTIHSYKIVKP